MKGKQDWEIDKAFERYASGNKKPLTPKETNAIRRLITVYPDVDNWRSTRVTRGTPGCRQAYAIHTSRGRYVGFIQTDGGFFLPRPIEKFGVILRTFKMGTYPNTGELKQAVMYAYLLDQQRKSKIKRKKK